MRRRKRMWTQGKLKINKKEAEERGRWSNSTRILCFSLPSLLSFPLNLPKHRHWQERRSTEFSLPESEVRRGREAVLARRSSCWNFHLDRLVRRCRWYSRRVALRSMTEDYKDESHRNWFDRKARFERERERKVPGWGKGSFVLHRVTFAIVYLRIVFEENRLLSDRQWSTIVCLPMSREFVKQLEEKMRSKSDAARPREIRSIEITSISLHRSERWMWMSSSQWLVYSPSSSIVKSFRLSQH